jgi:hypothetical protein
MLYWNFLRARYHCADNTVLRIKLTYGNTTFYHTQVRAGSGGTFVGRAGANVRVGLVILSCSPAAATWGDAAPRLTPTARVVDSRRAAVR